MNINNKNLLIQGRIRELISEYSSGVTDFADKIGTHQSTLSRALSLEGVFGEALINKVVIAFGINKDWILTGKGEKKSKEYHIEINPNNNDENDDFNYKLVPVYSLDVVGGINNQEVDTMGYITGYMPFVNAKSDDIVTVVTGNSMYPTYPAGCHVLIRKLLYWKEYIEYGQVHIIELMDERRLIKEIRKGTSKYYFKLISHNKNFDEDEISIDFIKSVWIVLAKYEKSTM